MASIRNMMIGLALAGTAWIGVDNADASTTSLIKAADTLSAATLGHAGGGYWRTVRHWVSPVYRQVPRYGRCGNFRGYRTITVRPGYWTCRRVWVRCGCRSGCSPW